jgi:hypothetical protein
MFYSPNIMAWSMMQTKHNFIVTDGEQIINHGMCLSLKQQPDTESVTKYQYTADALAFRVGKHL